MVFPDAGHYWLFVPAAVAILLIPGPAVLYVVTRSVGQGRAAGLVSALGLGLGNMFHVVAAALGLSALVASSAIAFSAVKYIGAAYLILIGIRRWLEKDDERVADKPPKTLRKIFGQGVIVNVLNPKVALFFLAFLPQFVEPARGGVAWQVFWLGLTFAVVGVITDSIYGFVGGTIGRLLRTSARFRRSERYVSGGIFISLGIAAALTSRVEK
jgi:threonine/homoserine/homoserine lactone efflux protein